MPDAGAMRAISLPPPPPVTEAKPSSPAVALAERVLGIDPTGERELFPAYTEIPAHLPLRLWQAIRIGSVIGYFALVVTLFVRPQTGLFVFFGIIVPLLPALFLVAPGVWRNFCPMAATNQVPRLFGFTRALDPPDWLRNRGYLISVAGFFGIAGARIAGLDKSGIATGVVLILVISVAFAGGYVFKGKSGWCSSICPLFALQRAYGQTPYLTEPNNHCPTCVGCAKNCYDFKPRAAYQADMTDPDRSWTGARKLFVGALPGFILGFFTLRADAHMPMVERYSLLLLFMFVSVGLFFAIDAVLPLSSSMVAVFYAAAALNIFYWFAGPVLAASFAHLTGINIGWFRWVISGLILLATLLWIARTRVVELQFACRRCAPACAAGRARDEGRRRLAAAPGCRRSPTTAAPTTRPTTTPRPRRRPPRLRRSRIAPRHRAPTRQDANAAAPHRAPPGTPRQPRRRSWQDR